MRRYPGLASHLPIAPLAQLPTPVERLDPLGRALGLRTLYVKRDDRGATTYGGNKVRKLELELGAAVAQGKTSVLTFGGVGSNHALATALYARSLGLRSLLMLLPEPPTPHVRHNLLAELAAGAEIQLASPARIDELVAKAEGGRVDPSGPYVIAPGGSSTLGNIAFVSAAFELAEQIAAGELPEPDALFVAMGTGGTAVGLAIGLRAAGLRTRVFGVRASSDKYVNEARVRSMALDVVRELRIRDAQFPEVTLQPDDLRILHRYVGRGYALPTRAGARAAALALSEAGLELDPTYTAKTVAAIAGEAARLGEAVVLYWHTYDARSVPHDDVTTEDLPAALRGYARAKR